MIQFIKNTTEFETEQDIFFQKYKDGINFPENVFSTAFQFYVGFNHDLIYKEAFFDGLKIFISSLGNEDFTFYTIDPSPQKYFFKHFNKYSIAKITTKDSSEEYNNFLLKDPGDSPADAMQYNSELVAIYSISTRWAIATSKDWEVGIVGFNSLNDKINFIKSFNFDEQMFFSIKELIEIYEDYFHWSVQQKALYWNFVKNYSDKID